MNIRTLHIVTAILEAATGLILVLVPEVLLALLLGIKEASTDTRSVGRVAGAALLAIATSSWLARADSRTRAQLALVAGLLVYNSLVAVLLAIAGSVLAMAGVLLWPTVVAHSALAAWCVACLRGGPRISG
jgi:hypothetical protein